MVGWRLTDGLGIDELVEQLKSILPFVPFIPFVHRPSSIVNIV
jgi:hypothetical protein